VPVAPKRSELVSMVVTSKSAEPKIATGMVPWFFVLIEFGSLFREPLAIGGLNGVIAWRHDEGEWRFTSDELLLRNSDLQVRARMGVAVPDDGASPYVALDVKFNGEPGSVAHKSRYLPVSLIPNAVKWLDQSIIGGTVPDGTFIFNGRVNQFPFHHDEGKFEVRFRITDGILEYAEGWPRLEEIEADIRVIEQDILGMLAEVTGGGPAK